MVIAEWTRRTRTILSLKGGKAGLNRHSDGSARASWFICRTSIPRHAAGTDESQRHRLRRARSSWRHSDNELLNGSAEAERPGSSSRKRMLADPRASPWSTADSGSICAICNQVESLEPGSTIRVAPAWPDCKHHGTIGMFSGGVWTMANRKARNPNVYGSSSPITRTTCSEIGAGAFS